MYVSKKAIEKAIAGGWKRRKSEERAALDPSFWKALKVPHWKLAAHKLCFLILYKSPKKDVEEFWRVTLKEAR